MNTKNSINFIYIYELYMNSRGSFQITHPSKNEFLLKKVNPNDKL